MGSGMVIMLLWRLLNLLIGSFVDGLSLKERVSFSFKKSSLSTRERGA
jgi:hypothetical protein